MSEDQRNLFIAVILSVVVLLGFNYFSPKPTIDNIVTKNEEVTKETLQQNKISNDKEFIKSTVSDPKVLLSNNKLQTEINLKGCFLDQAKLSDYKETIDKNSNPVSLLDSILPRTVWISESAKNLPNQNTVWTQDKNNHFIYDNPDGLKFERSFHIDDDYLVTITDTVYSNQSKPFNITLSAELLQIGTPQTSNNWILHEGAVGVLGEKLQEYTYKDMNKSVDLYSNGGWLGFTDKYFLVSVAPIQTQKINASFFKNNASKFSNDIYTASYKNIETILEPNSSVSFKTYVYIGPKSLSVLNKYQEEKDFTKFHLAVDFGILYFVTKPLFLLLTQINNFVGNFGVAILLLTMLLKLFMFPIATKSFKSMMKMKDLAPKMEYLKKNHGQDRTKLNQELMDLYKKEGVNPVSGCLPMIVQAPIFFCLYKVLFVTIEMRHAPFYLWIRDLSEPDPTNLFNLFGLLPFSPPSILHMGVLPLIMGLTMVIQQKLNPKPADPAQAKAMMLMPIFFTFLLASFPSGLVLYWTCSNVLTILQQLFIQKKFGVKK